MINTRYEIIKKIGEGRSSVYLCKDIEFPVKDYAIKILPRGIDDKERKNFVKEYFILKKLEHPNIIRPFGLGTVVHVDNEDEIEIGSSYITLEYFDGNELLKSREINDEANLREIVKQICSVLYYLHQSKYIYYDLKPENILVSFKEDKPQIRLIDLGLAEYSPSTSDYEIKGTAHYIAPELLKKESHNNSVDLYSLGIILYKIIYNRFPFDAENELDIYKAAVESDFNFPPTENYSPELVNITKKLLEKNLKIRFPSALAVLKDLGFTLDSSVTKEFLPARVFSSRDYAINMLSKYISDKSSSEVFTVKGFDGVGKTSLLNQMQEHFPQAIFIYDIKVKSGAELIRYILRKIIFSESVFPHLTEEDKVFFLRLMNKSEEDILDDLRSTVILLSSKSKFILLIDDFNLFDQLTIDLLLEIIPFFQVNNINVIISESSEHDFLSSKINNVREVNLGPFTDEEMKELLDVSYSNDFPKKELQDLILSYADLIPGNIKSFIKDLILLGIMKFSEKGISFSDEDDKLSILKEAHFVIYDLRLFSLSAEELKAVKVIAAIDTFIDLNTFTQLLDLSGDASGKLIKKLEINNVVQQYNSGQTIIFTSEAMKKHIYASLKNKKEFHREIAEKISERVPAFNRLEESRQYELAGEYEICFRISMTEIEEAEKHSAFAYMKNILEHLIKLPLNVDSMNKAKIKLSEAYFKLSEFKSAIKTIETIQSAELNEQQVNNLKTIQAGSLIGIGEYGSAKIIINNLLTSTNNVAEKQRLAVELAYTEFEQKNYTVAEENCNLILDNPELSAELSGRCYNLKGMLRIYKDDDLNSALQNFKLALEFFQEAKLMRFEAAMENNIGNIYNILGEYDKAEKHWKSASQINQSIGNLNWDGVLLQNIGLFYLSRQKPDLAIDSYQKAHKIFLSLGNEINRGLILINLGEAYLKICEYEKSFTSLIEATKVFTQLGDFEELAEALLFLGKFYNVIGAKDGLNETVNSFESNLNAHKLPSKHDLNLRYLKVLNLNINESQTSTEELKLISEEYKKLDDKTNYQDCQLLLVNFLILEAKYPAALEEINQPYLLDLCSQNSILEAEREYFLGIISRHYVADQLLPSLVHFEKAYDLIKDENIFELTWKILFEISDLYIERGNLNKAKQFVVYSRELIYFISEKIESPRLRAAYLKQTERLNILKQLESFYPT